MKPWPVGLGFGLIVVIGLRGLRAPSRTMAGLATDIALMFCVAGIAYAGGSVAGRRQAERSGAYLLAWLCGPAVLAQICLGAAYRHEFWGVLPHMAGAAVATALLLIWCLLLLQETRAPRKPAIAVMAIVLAQVSLGIAAFTLRLLDLESSRWFSVVSAAHISVGALTLAAAVLLGRLVIGNPPAHGEDASPKE
jgi:hypothetical protein